MLRLVSTLNLGPFEARVIWDTGASKTIGGMHEEEAIFRGANHVRIGTGIDRRDDRGDLSKAGGVAANFLSLEEKVWTRRSCRMFCEKKSEACPAKRAGRARAGGIRDFAATSVRDAAL